MIAALIVMLALLRKRHVARIEAQAASDESVMLEAAARSASTRGGCIPAPAQSATSTASPRRLPTLTPRSART
jgi:hypothetical protein